jgi:hypothetical protein
MKWISEPVETNRSGDNIRDTSRRKSIIEIHSSLQKLKLVASNYIGVDIAALAAHHAFVLLCSCVRHEQVARRLLHATL